MKDEQNGKIIRMKDGKTGTELSEEQVTEVVKKKRGAKWMRELAEDGAENVEPGDNSRFVRYALASWNLPPIDISDAQQVEERLGMYFKYCMDNDRRPQVVGMCNWLGVSRDTVNTWKRGEYRNGAHSDIIRKAYDLMEEMWIDYMQSGKINPATGIFLAKNFFAYKDVADVVVTPNDPMKDLDADQARRRITDAIPADEDE